MFQIWIHIDVWILHFKVAHILPRKPTVELECLQILVDFHFVNRKKEIKDVDDGDF